MLAIFLTDVKQQIQFDDYPGEHPVKFVLSFKKIFPSIMELLLPVLPENENLEEMTWESTTQDFSTFQKLLQGWGIIELRLNAMTQFKDRQYAEQLIKKAKLKRDQFKAKYAQLSSVDLDYIFMHEIHASVDAELFEIGEKFYLPTLRSIWEDQLSSQVLNVKFQ